MNVFMGIQIIRPGRIEDCIFFIDIVVIIIISSIRKGGPVIQSNLMGLACNKNGSPAELTVEVLLTAG